MPYNLQVIIKKYDPQQVARLVNIAEIMNTITELA
jgi:hypothetical protein